MFNPGSQCSSSGIAMAMDEISTGDPARSFTADPNLPRWVCQNCRHALCVVGAEPYADKFFADPSRSGLQSSTVQGSTMDHSFVVLPRQRTPGHAGVPPRPQGGSVALPSVEGGGGGGVQAHKQMEGSFVVLPPAAASMYNCQAAGAECGGSRPPSAPPGASTGGGLPATNSGFEVTITALKRTFDMATSQTQVEQPLCLECMMMLLDKMEKEIEDVNRDIKAYDACIQQFESETYNALSEADFLREKMKVEEEEKRLLSAIEEIEKKRSEVNSELEELESRSKQFKELEERYWHEFNDFHFQLTAHQEERDAILAKIEVSQAHLDLLKRTNVLNDAFYIWHDGEFGTINNFRLGRLPKIPVEWDEINAAWGQACLLLHTMTQYFRPKFQYRIKIIPMGSYPRIMDTSDNTYELFGPVNMFWSTRYDRAMTLFLTCLKDFSEFANLKDQENGVPPEKRFKLPYKIENDKLEGYTITQSFNKMESWTKALKYTVCNLKWVLYWFVGNTSFQPLTTPHTSP